MFHALDGKRLRYRYVGEDLQPLLRAYAYSGVVRVLGRVHFNAKLDPISIDIQDVQLAQPQLFERK
jgi:hypothetical protein